MEKLGLKYVGVEDRALKLWPWCSMVLSGISTLIILIAYLKKSYLAYINFRKKCHRKKKKKSRNQKIHWKNLFLTFKTCPGSKYKFTVLLNYPNLT